MTEDFNGAKVALFIGDRLLTILRDDRPDIPFPNTWDFPGGGREGAETPFQTMARETREEVALIVPREAVIWERRYATSSAGVGPSWFFVARLPSTVQSDIILGDEGQTWQLVTPQAYLAMPNTIPNMVSRVREWLEDPST